LKDKIIKDYDNGKEKDFSSYLNKSSKADFSKINKSNAIKSNSNYSSSKNSSSYSDSESKNNSKTNYNKENNISDFNSRYSIRSSLNNIQKNCVLIKKEGRNSTRFEVKEGEINSATNINNAIPFYEGYFGSAKNNPFLRNISLYDGIDFNYIYVLY